MSDNPLTGWLRVHADDDGMGPLEDAADLIDRLQQCIEELEEILWVKYDANQKPIKGRHIITTKQIDAAWAAAFNLEGSADECCQMEMERVFRQLGIVRCEGCGGTGMLTRSCPIDKWPDSEVASDCHTCNGHRWVKK